MKHRLFLVALLVCGTAQAADWVEAFHNNAGTAYFDASRLKIDGDIRSGWFKVVLPPHTRGVSGKYQTYMVALQSFDCRKETVRLESLTSYFNDGSIIGDLCATPNAAEPAFCGRSSINSSIITNSLMQDCAWILGSIC